MAATIGHRKVPMLITISAGDPALDIASVTTDLKLSITGETRPLGEGGVTIRPDLINLRTSIASALREAADELEQQTGTELGDRINVAH